MALWNIDSEGKYLRRVKVQVLDLTWGGEFIDNPCQFVLRIVVELVIDSTCRKVCFFVDFGCYLGIQEVLVDV